MRKLLLDKENIPVLETLLEQANQEYEPIKALKESKKLDFGKKLSKEELKETFTQVRNKVDAFLGVSDIEPPKCSYYSLFRPGITTTPVLLSYIFSSARYIASISSSMGLIDVPFMNVESSTSALEAGVTLSLTVIFHDMFRKDTYIPLFGGLVSLAKNKRCNLIPSAGHEYTHHVQKNHIKREILDNIKRTFSMFDEGHARGVQEYLARTYAEKEDNPAFLYDTLDTKVGELKRTYKWICKKLGVQKRESLLKTKSSRDGSKRISKPSKHALGNTFFSIYEAKRGPQIYDNILHGTFQFSR